MTIQAVDPYAGFEYLADEVVVSADYQADKLRACGIDPDVFGNDVDPSFFIGLAIHAGIRSGISAEGNINMLQSIEQHRPVRTGETLRVSGVITGVADVPRGRTVETEVNFSDSAGSVVISANRTSLKPDADKAGSRGAGERPPPVLHDLSELMRHATYQLTPAGVKAYSTEGNSIHYDEAAAQSAGFRAPLIGGGMGVHYLMAGLWTLHPVLALRMHIYFRRPVFWDEAVTVATREQGEGMDAMALLKPDGRVGTEIALHHYTT